MTNSHGIHHITAITGNPQANLDFYEGFLGQRLVKRTVNFDDPRSYHFYFADYPGTPGTLLTFFYWKGIPKGTHGNGEVSRVKYLISGESAKFWLERAAQHNISSTEYVNQIGERVISLQDPDDMRIELVLSNEGNHTVWWSKGTVPEEHALRALYAVEMSVVSIEEMALQLEALGYVKVAQIGEWARFRSMGDYARFVDVLEAPDLQMSRQGSGSVHHVAFRAENDIAELQLRTQVESAGARPTPVIDRNYFHSVYFMTPGRILFEIATDAPGFQIDEPLETLGESLVLPAMYEAAREQIEAHLEPITLPRHA